jgi:glyoxylase-like metal-dependent hydrolase (beta-lactamase superfamily II)/rhodanese-related sulfurtransferase
MIFRQLFDADSCSYTYLLAGESGGQALLIDPVRERIEQYLRLLDELGLRLVKAVDTHLHFDHASALGALRDRTRCITVAGARSQADVVSMRVEDGDRIGVEGVELRVLATPGHTPCSCCFAAADRVFTGDTLLIRGTGRTDLPGGDAAQQYHSLFGKLLALPPETLVYPGHDYRGESVSTIGEERAHNPRLRVRSAEEYAALMGALELEDPKRMDEVVPANRRIGADQGAGREWGLPPADAFGWLGRPDALFVDLREADERARSGAIPGSAHVAYQELEPLLAPGALLSRCAEGRRLLFYCAFGERSALAVAAARERGLGQSAHLIGGIDAWRRAGGPVVAAMPRAGARGASAPRS